MINNNKYRLKINLIIGIIIALIVCMGMFAKKVIDSVENQNIIHAKQVAVRVSNDISNNYKEDFEKITSVYDNQGEFYIVNKDDKVVFSKEKNAIGKSLHEYLYKDTNKQVIVNKDKEISNKEEGTVSVIVDDEKVYIGYAKIASTDELYVVSYTVPQEMFKNTDMITRMSIRIIVLTILIFIIIGFHFFITQEKLKKANYKDKTTNINNYEKFISDTRKLIKDKEEYKRILIINFDIDKFKLINEIHGHETGDIVLKIIAENLKQNFDSKSAYGRIIGDTFGIAIEVEAIEKELQMIVDIIKKDIVNLKGHEELDYAFNIQACVGIYIMQENDDDIKKMVSNADLARVKSKDNIYKPYVVFDENMRAEIKLIAKLEKDLYVAIEKSEFKLHYQSKYNVNTGEIIGATN